MTCTSPCTISGLYPDTKYLFTVIPNSNCGSPTACTGNTATVQTAGDLKCEYPFLCVCVNTYKLVLCTILNSYCMNFIAILHGY